MMKRPGKYPISPDTMEKVQKMTDNMLKLDVFNIPLKDILYGTPNSRPFVGLIETEFKKGFISI